jgi:uncharacterized protein YndB with AHSA1/START domain
LSTDVRTVKVTQEIAAPAEQVWGMVADVTRMGEWSPENESARWSQPSGGPARGAKFKGTNRNGKRSWKTTGQVTDAEPGRLFAFSVTAAGFKVAQWRFEFEPTPSGCKVTEIWVDRRGHIAAAIGKPVSGVADRASHNQAGMEETLKRLKSAAESGLATGDGNGR